MQCGLVHLTLKALAVSVIAYVIVVCTYCTPTPLHHFEQAAERSIRGAAHSPLRQHLDMRFNDPTNGRPMQPSTSGQH